MMLVYSLLILLGLTSTIFAASGRCFQFTWNVNNQNLSAKCESEEMKNRPCILPVVFTEDNTQPDVNAIWERGNRTAFSCPMTNTCVKYSYTYNNAVEHLAYFCGKVTENNETAIKSGCYSAKDGGYTIEVCACLTQGDNNTFPCNSSSLAYISINLFIFLVLISMMNDNKFFQRFYI